MRHDAVPPILAIALVCHCAPLGQLKASVAHPTPLGGLGIDFVDMFVCLNKVKKKKN